MNVDLTPEEMAQLIRCCEASDMSNNVTVAAHHKIMRCLNNFRDMAEEARLTPTGDAVEASQQWRQPI